MLELNDEVGKFFADLILRETKKMRRVRKGHPKVAVTVTTEKVVKKTNYFAPKK